MNTYIPPPPDLPDEVSRELGFWVSMHANNDFLGGGAKTDIVRALRSVQHAEALTPSSLYDWLLNQEDCTREGASRVVDWYRRVLEGRKLREGNRYI